MERELSEAELGYAAGFLDGEGTIGIYVRHPRRVGCNEALRIHISAAQVDKRPLLWMQERFGGYIGRSGNPKEGHRQPFAWQVSGSKQCLPILKALMPYLVLKREQAEIAIEFCVGYKNMNYMPRGHRIQESERERRCGLQLRIKELNRRGSLPAETKRSGTERSCDSPNCKEMELAEASRNGCSPRMGS